MWTNWIGLKVTECRKKKWMCKIKDWAEGGNLFHFKYVWSHCVYTSIFWIPLNMPAFEKGTTYKPCGRCDRWHLGVHRQTSLQADRWKAFTDYRGRGTGRFAAEKVKSNHLSGSGKCSFIMEKTGDVARTVGERSRLVEKHWQSVLFLHVKKMCQILQTIPSGRTQAYMLDKYLKGTTNMRL